MSARLAIGLLTYSAKPRGSVVHAAQLAEALAERGHDVTLYALEKDGQGFHRQLRCRFVGIPAVPAVEDGEALIAQRIGEVAAFAAGGGLREPILHAQDCLVASGVLAARRCLRGAKLVRTVHHVERFASPYLERCQRRSIVEADQCVTVSPMTRAEVRRVYGPDCPIVGNGVDHARFANVTAFDAAALRARLGIATDAPLLVSIGGVEPRKNTARMLDAFLAARVRTPALRWVIAGGASIFEHAAYRQAFAARLATLDEAARRAIVLAGVLDDDALAALLKGADVLLHASVHEGFGLCVLEGMAAGARVVVSRGAPFDQIVDDACAVRVDSTDAGDIARGIDAALVRDPIALARASTRAAAHAWSRCAALHEDVYARLAT